MKYKIIDSLQSLHRRDARTTWWSVLLVSSLLAGVATQAAAPFFPFCIDWHDAKKRGFEEQAAMLKELGYDDIGYTGWVQIESAVPKGMKTPAAYKANLKFLRRIFA